MSSPMNIWKRRNLVAFSILFLFSALYFQANNVPFFQKTRWFTVEFFWQKHNCAIDISNENYLFKERARTRSGTTPAPMLV